MRHFEVAAATTPAPPRPRLGRPDRTDPAHYSPPRAMRCACKQCGAHTIATVGYKIAGNCPNCGSYELEAVAPIGG